MRFKLTTAIESNKAVPPTCVELQLCVREKLSSMEGEGEVDDVNIAGGRMGGKDTCKCTGGKSRTSDSGLSEIGTQRFSYILNTFIYITFPHRALLFDGSIVIYDF